MVSGGAAAFGTSSHGALPRVTTGLTPIFYSKSLASSTLNPYCNVGTPTSPYVLICYTPQDLKAAYNYPGYLTGAGQTIVIIDAFGSPFVQSDLNTFDSFFGLPSTTVQIVCQNNALSCPNPMANSDEVGWTAEIALDTQYSHAMAPGAQIVLFVAYSDDDLVLEQAAQQAVAMFPHAVISQSFGDPELNLELAPPAYVQSVLSTGEGAYEQAAREGTTVFAAAGDWGADNSPFGFTAANPIYPSSSPWVTAVGGTQGNPYYLGAIPTCHGRTCSTGLVKFLNTPACALNNPNPTGSEVCVPVGYGGEQVWNEPAFGAATGGAPSLIFGVPLYQHGLGLTGRATPDVSYNAAQSGGVIGYWGNPAQPGFYILAGTSSGSPQWAAIAALADQLAGWEHRGTIGFINPALYLIGHLPWLYRSDFNDITVGNNTVVGSPDNVGFSAARGWDNASGWGTPNVANLVPDLVALTGWYQ
jgi:subtilase family serine protease